MAGPQKPRLTLILPALLRVAVLGAIALVLGIVFDAKLGLWFAVISLGVLLALHMAYLSLLASPLEPLETLVRDLRERFDGVVLLNDGFGDVTTLDSVEKLLGTGLADAVVVGRPFLANPDLDERWRKGADLNEPDQETFYGGGAEGYTDYPTLDEAS